MIIGKIYLLNDFSKNALNELNISLTYFAEILEFYLFEFVCRLEQTFN